MKHLNQILPACFFVLSAFILGLLPATSKAQAPLGAMTNPIELGTLCAHGDSWSVGDVSNNPSLGFGNNIGYSSDDVWHRFSLSEDAIVEGGCCGGYGDGYRVVRYIVERLPDGSWWTLATARHPSHWFSVQLSAGTYYLVFETDGLYTQTHMQLSVAATGVSVSGSTPNTAFPLPVLNCGEVFSDVQNTQQRCFQDADSDGNNGYYYRVVPSSDNQIQINATAVGFTPSISLLTSALQPACTNCLNVPNSLNASIIPGNAYYILIEDENSQYLDRGAITTTITRNRTGVPTLFTVTPSSVTITPGSNASFTASGACTYSWAAVGGGSVGSGTTFTVSPPVTTSYTVTGTSSSGQSSSATVVVTVVPVDQRLNRIIVRTPRVANLRTLGKVQNATLADCAVHTTYFDGLSRPMQEVDRQDSPQGRDVVLPYEYDVMGRQAKQYLPYTGGRAAPGNDGGYQSDAVQAQADFYRARDNQVVQDNHPWSVAEYDASPLDRLLEQGAPGSDWQPGTTHTQRLIENGNWAQIRRYSVTASNTFILETPYALDQLLVKEQRDEQDLLTLTYIDRDGRVVYTQKQLPTTGGWEDMYYIYDDFGSLRVVIQPAGMREFYNSGIANLPQLPQTFLDKWCIRYDYDERQRLRRKYVPGGGLMSYVYNRRNQTILVGDVNSNWQFIKYDAYGRVIQTGLWTGAPAANTAENIQQLVDNSGAALWEGTQDVTVINGQPQVEYTNVSFPTTNIEYLTQAFYDHYNHNAFVDANHHFEEAEFNAQQIDPTDPNRRSLVVSYDELAIATTGQLTGMQERVLGTSDWLTTTHYYDPQGREIQSLADLGEKGMERTSYTYSFKGLLEQAYTQHAYRGDYRELYLERFYDPGDRLVRTDLKVGTMPLIQLAKYEYNEIGELVDKYLHSTNKGASFLQSVDFRYNIRGWLTHINNRDLQEKPWLDYATEPTLDAPATSSPDLWGLELIYNQPFELKSGTQVPARYDGTVVGAMWRVNNSRTEYKLHGYAYQYDDLSRLVEARYATYDFNGSNWEWGNVATSPLNTDYSASYAYDANGNIQEVRRAGEPGLPNQLIDKLSYHYDDLNGNRLIGVDDQVQLSTPTNDFEELSTYAPGTPEYGYDARGNLTSDANKGIGQIEYNHLNLPTVINFTDSRTITNTYSAMGRKLRSVAHNPANPLGDHVTEYVGPGGWVYEKEPLDDPSDPPTLKFIPTDEGRLLYDLVEWRRRREWVYEYHLKDHLGNLRVAFRNTGYQRPGGGGSTSFEPAEKRTSPLATDSSSEALEFKHVVETRRYDPLYARTGQHVAKLGGAERQILGPSTSTPIHAGDSVYAEVWGRYELPARPWLGVGKLVGLAAPPTSEVSLSSRAGNRWLPRLRLNLAPLLFGSRTGQTTPRAYLEVVIYSADSVEKARTRKYLDPSADPSEWQYLQAKLAATENGYVTAELKSDDGQPAYFDDLTLAIIDPNAIQEAHCDPFGQNLVAIETAAPRNNRWQFNGQERIDDFDLLWNDHGPRQFDLQLGRWWQMDAQADDPHQLGLSSYHFGFNSPASFADPSGYCPACGNPNISHAWDHEGDTGSLGGANFRHDGTSWGYWPGEYLNVTPANGIGSSEASGGGGGWEAAVVSNWQGDVFSHNPYVSPDAYLWTYEEIQQGTNIGLSVASLAMGGPGVAMGIRAGLTAGLRSFAGKAALDASVQFGAGMISSGGDIRKAAGGINLVESGLAGVGVSPVSAAIYSASFQVSGSGIGFTGASGRDFIYQAGVGAGFGAAGNVLQKRALPFALATSLRGYGLGGRVGTAAGLGLWHGGIFGYDVGAEYIENRP